MIEPAGTLEAPVDEAEEAAAEAAVVPGPEAAAPTGDAPAEAAAAPSGEPVGGRGNPAALPAAGGAGAGGGDVVLREIDDGASNAGIPELPPSGRARQRAAARKTAACREFGSAARPTNRATRGALRSAAPDLGGILGFAGADGGGGGGEAGGGSEPQQDVGVLEALDRLDGLLAASGPPRAEPPASQLGFGVLPREGRGCIMARRLLQGTCLNPISTFGSCIDLDSACL